MIPQQIGLKKSMSEAKKLSVSELKNFGLTMIKEIEDTGCAYIITKRGISVAKVIPYCDTVASVDNMPTSNIDTGSRHITSNNLYSYLKDSVTVKDNLENPTNVSWDADSIE